MADIVYVDDDPSTFMAQSTEDQRTRIEAVTFHPEDTGDDLLAASSGKMVWLFDFFLVAPSTDSHRDENGLSLFQKWKAVVPSWPTIVVVSSDIEKAIGEPIGPMARRHVIAQRHGVDWIGDKSLDKASETLSQVIQLADAATLISKLLKVTKTDKANIGNYDPEGLCFDVLGASRKSEWANSAQRQVDRARPPREVPLASEAAAARSILIWLLGHVLPYPSFLLSDGQAALRLKLSPKSFAAIADEAPAQRQDSNYRTLLHEGRYAGPLAAFFGRRWWRAAVDDLAWHLSQDKGGYEEGLSVLAGTVPVELLTYDEPVLLSDPSLVETVDVAEASQCVRVTDEDFPANVDPAWVLLEVARKDRDLAAKVVYEDRELLRAE